MKVTQIYQILNDVVKEVLGESAVVNEDLSNVVDIGNAILDGDLVDKYLKKLINRIGRTIFVARKYDTQAPSVLMEGWEYGSIMQKIRTEMPQSTENPTWALESGKVYEQDLFTAPNAYNKFYNSLKTYEIPMSYAYKQIKQSFLNEAQLNAFFSMIEMSIKNRKTVDFDNLIMMTIRNFMGASIVKNFGTANVGSSSFPNTRNLLYEFNKWKYGDTAANYLKASQALYNEDFLKFASMEFSLASDNIQTMSTIFNIGGTEKFTPREMQKIVMHSRFRKATSSYLQSDTFNKELVSLPEAETVKYWQGTGTKFEWESTSAMNVSVFNPNNPATKSQIVMDGILGCIFDRDSLGVANMQDYVTSHNNQHAEFVNYWYKYEANYFNDYDENFIMFYIADAPAA